MTLGAVGCLLSHLKLYKKMIDENVEVACILEDDAVLKTHFAKIITSRQVRQGPWDVLLLGHYSMHKKCFTRGAEALYWRRWTYKNHCIARPAEFPFTTLAYLIKKEAAKRLIDYAYPLRMPADWVLSNVEFVGMRLRLIKPPCVLPHWPFRNRSTVRHSTDASRDTLLKKYAPFIENMSRQEIITRRIDLKEADAFVQNNNAQAAPPKPPCAGQKNKRHKPQSQFRKTISVVLRKLGYAKNTYVRPL